MKIAITGGTGFVGRHLARSLIRDGHEVVLIARGVDHRDETIRQISGATFAPIGTGDEEKLVRAFEGCHAVAHCAGINCERGNQTYQQVHIQGTRNVINAAKRAGVRKVVILSFLRARPLCGSAYHESKWAAEEIVRNSGLDYTVIKAGVIYGTGDHMLAHLSHAFHTFPIFALVGMKDKPVRPTAVEDMVRILQAVLIEKRLSRQTVAVTGPEEMTLGDAVKRVARVIGRRPLVFRMSVWFHYLLGWCCKQVMTIPLISAAQVRILSEGVVDPFQPCGILPDDLTPKFSFTDDQIRNGLPPARSFGSGDLRCFPQAT